MDHLNPRLKALLQQAQAEERPGEDARRRVRRALATSLTMGVGATTVLGKSVAQAAGSLHGAAGPVAAQAGAVGGSAFKGGLLSQLGVSLLVGATAGVAVVVPVSLLVGRGSPPTPTAPVLASRPVARAAPANPPAAALFDPSHPALLSGPYAASDRAAPNPAPWPSDPTVPRAATSTRRPALGAGGTDNHGARSGDFAVVNAPNASNVVRADTLARETALLGNARALLRAGRARDSLAVLAQHQREHPNALLREEAMAAQVLALCAAGRASEARAQAARFSALFPHSPLEPRVNRACRTGGP